MWLQILETLYPPWLPPLTLLFLQLSVPWITIRSYPSVLQKNQTVSAHSCLLLSSQKTICLRHKSQIRIEFLWLRVTIVSLIARCLPDTMQPLLNAWALVEFISFYKNNDHSNLLLLALIFQFLLYFLIDYDLMHRRLTFQQEWKLATGQGGSKLIIQHQTALDSWNSDSLVLHILGSGWMLAYLE